MGEAEPLVGRPVDQRGCDGAGLRQEGQAGPEAGAIWAKTGVQLQRRHEQADRVGPDDAEGVGPRGVHIFLAQPVLCRSPPAVMTTATRVPFWATPVIRPGTVARRRDDDREVRRPPANWPRGGNMFMAADIAMLGGLPARPIPRNPRRRMLESTDAANRPGRGEAPMTVTDFGRAAPSRLRIA